QIDARIFDLVAETGAQIGQVLLLHLRPTVIVVALTQVAVAAGAETRAAAGAAFGEAGGLRHLLAPVVAPQVVPPPDAGGVAAVLLVHHVDEEKLVGADVGDAAAHGIVAGRQARVGVAAAGAF